MLKEGLEDFDLAELFGVEEMDSGLELFDFFVGVFGAGRMCLRRLEAGESMKGERKSCCGWESLRWIWGLSSRALKKTSLVCMVAI
jgi:hypothetical protein